MRACGFVWQQVIGETDTADGNEKPADDRNGTRLFVQRIDDHLRAFCIMKQGGISEGLLDESVVPLRLQLRLVHGRIIFFCHARVTEESCYGQICRTNSGWEDQ